MKRRLWTATIFGLLLCLACALTTGAQVSCSALVPAPTCKLVSELANGPLNNLLKFPVPMEVLTPDEYSRRKTAIRSEDDSTGRVMCNPSASNPPCPITQKLQEFNMTWTDDMMFIRDRDSQGSFPSKIIVSTDQFENMLFDKRDCPCLDAKGKNGKDTVTNKYGIVVIKDGVPVLDGKTSIDKIEEAITFIQGYFSGLVSMGRSNDEVWIISH
jgi:hypothetical protein